MTDKLSIKRNVVERRERVAAMIGASNGLISGGSIGRELGVSNRTIWRDIRSLKNHGYPIRGAAGAGYLMGKRRLAPGDIVQLSPECKNPMLAYCFMVVTEPKSWGAIGYVQGTGQDGKPGGQAYYRANHDEMSWVGHAEWWIP